MKHLLKSIWRSTRNLFWAVGVAYMLAFHNIYYEEQKFKEDIVIVVEEESEQEDTALKE